MLWRKRFRTLEKKHNNWVAKVNDSKNALTSDENRDLLAILAEAAEWDQIARLEEHKEKEDAAAAAKAVVESRQALEDAQKRKAAAEEALQDAQTRGAAAVAREEAVLVRETAMAVRHEAMARQEKALTDKEAALAEAERAAADRAAELGLEEKRLQSSQRSHARSAAPKPPTFTNATPGTHAHHQWKRSQVKLKLKLKFFTTPSS